MLRCPRLLGNPSFRYAQVTFYSYQRHVIKRPVICITLLMKMFSVCLSTLHRLLLPNSSKRDPCGDLIIKYFRMDLNRSKIGRISIS